MILEDPRSKKLNFEPDGRLHYVYRVTCLNSRTYYYGSKTDFFGKLPTIGISYFTCSHNSKFKKDFKKNPKNYFVKIVAKFKERSSCILFESYLHTHFDVKIHPKFINLANQTPFGFDRTGVEVSEETKALLVKANAELNADPKRLKIKSQKLSEAQTALAADSERLESRRQKLSDAAVVSNEIIKKDPIKAKRRKKKKSIAAVKAAARIAADPKLSKQLSQKLSISSTKAHEEIRNDPIRYKERSKNQSEAAINFQAVFAQDLNKFKNRSEKQSAAAKKENEEIRADPVRLEKRSRKLSTPIEQFDLEDNFIKEFYGQKEAAKQMGYPNSNGINSCVNGHIPNYKGYIWKKK